MFKRILIANRGEIACRIIQTAQKLGIECVAVYSDADHDEPHVHLADIALALYGTSAQESYLDQDKLIALAKAYHIDAIHPGYGFLSENASFAKKLAKAGITFIGPSHEAIALMGSKKDAKAHAEKIGVPTVPGITLVDKRPKSLAKDCEAIGYPLLIKAASGGGGKGMRIVQSGDELDTAISQAQSEAKASFDDDTVIIEKYLAEPRHIECQVFADTHGNVVHLFERDCSIQRRYQKIIEEAPAPQLDPSLKERLYEYAVRLTRSIDYAGAGTLEFLVEGSSVYFMEMNTRLQVEHPVTEMITGFDLVEWQLRVAADEVLPARQEDIRQQGHAVEARLYAEVPFEDFKPATGTLRHLHLPKPSEALRIDHALYESQTVSTYYDPMLGKFIAHGKSRAAAIQTLKRALEATRLQGIETNLWYLHQILDNPVFQSGVYSTRFIGEQHETLRASTRLEAKLAIIAYRVFQSMPPLSYFRLNQPRSTQCYVREGDDSHFVSGRVLPGGRLIIAGLDDNAHALDRIQVRDDRVSFEYQSEACEAVILPLKNGLYTAYGLGAPCTLTLSDEPATHQSELAAESLACSPMPGTVTAVLVKKNGQVNQGDGILVIEAMKMQHTLTAPKNGRVKEIFFEVGEQVAEGQTLFDFEAEDV